MEKVVKALEQFYVDFTDDELAELGLKKGDKLSVKIDENTKEVKLVPYETIDINLSEFSRETLEFLISESVEKDASVNEVITDILDKAIKHLKYEE